MKVELLSGLIGEYGEYICADCYVDGQYGDFIKDCYGSSFFDEFDNPLDYTKDELDYIESEIRRQYY